MKAQFPMKQVWTRAVFACVLFGAGSTQAQVVVSVPTTNSNTAIKPSYGGPKSPPLSDINSVFAKEGPLAQWGPIAVRPHFLYGLSYGDGLLNPGQLESQSSTIHTVSAGVLFEVGKHWTVDYTLSK